MILNFLGNQIKLFSFYFDFLQTNISLIVYFNQLTGAVHRFHWSKYAFCHFSPQFDKKKGENDNVKKSFSNMLVHTASPILITTKKKSFRLKIPHSSATSPEEEKKRYAGSWAADKKTWLFLLAQTFSIFIKRLDKG